MDSFVLSKIVFVGSGNRAILDEVGEYGVTWRQSIPESYQPGWETIRVNSSPLNFFGIEVTGPL
jgi:hypothetical protein